MNIKSAFLQLPNNKRQKKTAAVFLAYETALAHAAFAQAMQTSQETIEFADAKKLDEVHNIFVV